MGERLVRGIVVPVAAVAAAVLVGMVFLRLSGYPAVGTFAAIVRESFNDWYGFGQVLRATTLLTFTGLAVALAFRAGMFNIGVEGQLYIGAMALGVAGFYLRGLPPETLRAVPWAVWTAGLILLAMVTAGLWAAIPGVLRATTGAHEVITTIMMNFVAFSLINYLVRPEPESFAVPATLHTVAYPAALRMPRLSATFDVFQGSTVNWSLALAAAAAVGVWLLLRHSRLGFEIRAVGLNPVAARLAGIRPGRIQVAAMALSGALAGLVGVDFVLGFKGYFEEGFSAGLGYLGIAVALLARNNPLAVPLTAFLFGVLNYGKVAAAGEVPKDIIEILEAAIIFSMIAANRVFGSLALRMKKRAATAGE